MYTSAINILSVAFDTLRRFNAAQTSFVSLTGTGATFAQYVTSNWNSISADPAATSSIQASAQDIITNVQTYVNSLTSITSNFSNMVQSFQESTQCCDPITGGNTFTSVGSSLLDGVNSYRSNTGQIIQATQDNIKQVIDDFKGEINTFTI